MKLSVLLTLRLYMVEKDERIKISMEPGLYWYSLVWKSRQYSSNSLLCRASPSSKMEFDSYLFAQMETKKTKQVFCDIRMGRVRSLLRTL
jgi:hypothetical protein